MLSHFSCVWVFLTLWTVACQTLLSMGFSKQEYWSSLPCWPTGDLSDPGTKPKSLMSPALADELFTFRATRGNTVLNCKDLIFPLKIDTKAVRLLSWFLSNMVWYILGSAIGLLFSCPDVSDSLWSYGLHHIRPPCSSSVQ